MLGVLAGAAMLAGCGAAEFQRPTSSMLGLDSQSHSQSVADLRRTGILPEFFGDLHFGKPSRPRQARRKGRLDLFVADAGSGDVVLFKRNNYSYAGVITNGIDGPDGGFLDRQNNYYQANYIGNYITEYAPGKKKPSFTYTAGILNSVGVTVDKSGNVYEADFNNGGNGFVNEYAQARNAVVYSCSLGGAVEGAAVDSVGDVFVAYNIKGSPQGNIAEYKGGLNGCPETMLAPTFGYVGGLAIDKNGNLIVCDQLNRKIYVVDPPYTKISSELGSGYYNPFRVSVTKDNKLAFVADPGGAGVDVLDYPSGTLVTSLGTAYGIINPYGAVEAPNAVY